MSERDYYEILGVSRGATAEELKTAFRKLAAVHHPDRNQGDPAAAERFKELNQAYQVLSDPQKRTMYDRFGHQAAGGGGGGGSPFGGGNPFGAGFVDLNDIAFDGVLGDILGAFGVGKGDRGNIRRELEISFEEAAFGCTKRMTYERHVTCGDCHGGGSAPGHTAQNCGACNGRGKVRFQQGFLPLAVERNCSTCKGSGKIVTHPCTKCSGNGLVTSPNTLEVTLPEGVEDGATRMVTASGNKPRPDRPAGDLEILVRVRPHPFFQREGDDVICKMPITFTQAALGGESDIPTLDGKGKLRIPPGTQPGTVLRIRNKGIPRRGAGRGDQLVEVALEVPTSLTPRQREVIAELAKELGEEVLPQTKTFVEKLKDLFGT